jgi:hypothetical protein
MDDFTAAGGVADNWVITGFLLARMAWRYPGLLLRLSAHTRVEVRLLHNSHLSYPPGIPQALREALRPKKSAKLMLTILLGYMHNMEGSSIKSRLR